MLEELSETFRARDRFRFLIITKVFGGLRELEEASGKALRGALTEGKGLIVMRSCRTTSPGTLLCYVIRHKKSDYELTLALRLVPTCESSTQAVEQCDITAHEGGVRIVSSILPSRRVLIKEGIIKPEVIETFG